MKQISELSDRELQEWIYNSNLRQERHLKWISMFCSIVFALMVLGFLGETAFLFFALEK